MNIEEQIQQAHTLYQQKNYFQSAQLFESIASHFEELNEFPKSAELKNNASVAYLMMGNNKKAYDISKDTHLIFEQIEDWKNCGLALGNQASALESLGEKGLALQLFSRAAEYLEKSGDKKSKAYVQKRISSLQIQQGKQLEALGSMSSALDNIPKLSASEKILKKLTDLVMKIGSRQ
jgi:tetratricopeptide (TPR) repeat protein